MFGKIIDGKLVYAGLIIKNKNGGTISNPTEKDYVENGWKEIVYNERPTYDIENEKLVETYNEVNISDQIQDGITRIIINYEIVELTDIEKLEVKKQQVIMLEQQYNMCRWQREIILAENSGASQYTKDKAQEIENLAKDLR